MSIEIHPSAVVEDGTEIADDVVIGPNSYIESGAVIGEGTWIGSCVCISGFVRMGKNNKIYHGAAIGGPPQDLKFGGEVTTVVIGDNNVFRECLTVSRGTSESFKTTIGSNNLLMAYVHVAHDCRVGDNIVIANSVNMGGHVEIEDWAILGGLIPIHQFCSIGAHAIVGTGARIVQDVLPYTLVGSDPTRVAGINTIGLNRRGFEEKLIRVLKNCYKIIYNSKLPFGKALERIENEYSQFYEVQHILEFVKKSRRGILLK